METGLNREVVAYAQQAFAAALSGEHVPINPDAVKVFRGKDGSLMCMAEDPDRDRRATPYAWGAFYGDAGGGRVTIGQFYDPAQEHWHQPAHPSRYFSGPIPFITE